MGHSRMEVVTLKLGELGWFCCLPSQHFTTRCNFAMALSTFSNLSELFRMFLHIPSGKRLHSHGKFTHFQWVNPLFLWTIFNSYVSLPEGSCNIFQFGCLVPTQIGEQMWESAESWMHMDASSSSVHRKEALN